MISGSRPKRADGLIRKDSNMKALIVEDEMTSRIILENILKHFGEVHVCIDGHEAIESFGADLNKGAPFDIVCMDFMMPEIDGYMALRMIRAMEKDMGISRENGVKVIMTTGLNNIESEYDDIPTLCDAILLKPIRKAALVDCLRKLGFSKD